MKVLWEHSELVDRPADRPAGRSDSHFRAVFVQSAENTRLMWRSFTSAQSVICLLRPSRPVNEFKPRLQSFETSFLIVWWMSTPPVWVNLLLASSG